MGAASIRRARTAWSKLMGAPPPLPRSLALLLPDAHPVDLEHGREILLAGRRRGPAAADREVDEDMRRAAVGAVLVHPFEAPLGDEHIVDEMADEVGRPLDGEAVKAAAVVDAG